VEIRQEREGDATEILGPVGVAVHAVDTDTQNLGVGSPEARHQSLHARDLHASGGGVVEGIEEQQDVTPPAELREGDLTLELILQGKPGSFLACSDHVRLLHTILTVLRRAATAESGGEPASGERTLSR
jgi:hypothetical protein